MPMQDDQPSVDWPTALLERTVLAPPATQQPGRILPALDIKPVSPPAGKPLPRKARPPKMPKLPAVSDQEVTPSPEAVSSTLPAGRGSKSTDDLRSKLKRSERWMARLPRAVRQRMTKVR